MAFKGVEDLQREYTDNILKDGVFLKTTRSVHLRDVIDLSLELPLDGGSVELQGEVVHVLDSSHASSLGTDPGIGIHILDLDDTKRARIERFIAQHGGAIASAPPAPSKPGGKRRPSQSPASKPSAPYSTTAAPSDAPGEPDAPQVRMKFVSADALRKKYETEVSRGWVLIATSSPLPAHAAVRVVFVHPDTQDELEWRGVVASHVRRKGETRPAGMRVTLTTGEWRPSDVEAFIDGALAPVAVGEHTPLEGSLADRRLVVLLRALVQEHDQGVLVIRAPHARGVIVFQKGVIVNCFINPREENSLTPIEGSVLVRDKALVRMLGWDAGEYKFKPGGVRKVADPGWSHPVVDALQRAATHEIECTRLQAKLPLDDARLYVDVELAKQTFRSLSPDEQRVLKTIKKPKTIRTLLDEMPDSDAAILRALDGLTTRQIVHLR